MPEANGPDRTGGHLGDVARALRAGVGAQLRADAEEDERLAETAALRRRTLADVAAELAVRGDDVAVWIEDRRFTGRVLRASRDLLGLETAGGCVDVNLHGPVRLGSAGDAGRATGARALPVTGVGRDDAAPSFKARLYELEVAGVEVELGAAGHPDLRGRLRAVALDHVLVDDLDGRRWAVALDALRWVRQAGAAGTRRLT